MAHEYPEVIHDYISREEKLGRLQKVTHLNPVGCNDFRLAPVG